MDAPATPTTFEQYLATLDTHSPLNGSSQNSFTLDNSPHKRPRSDSPDTSVSSETSFFFYESAKTLCPAASTCVLRSILTPTSSSPLSSPPVSRPLSRHSSTSGTSKSVRFARCTNASVFPCLSSADYDRSSIIPTCESESLELPRRKRSEAEGWIKCVERERAAAARKDGVETSGPCAAFSPVPLPVEGVHGLIQGGYFVGDESGGIEFDDMVMTDDGTTTDEDVAPALVPDDTSGEDSDGVLSIASADVVIGNGATLVVAIPHHKATSPPLSVSPCEPKALGFGFLERSSNQDSEEEESDEAEFHPEDLDHEEEDEMKVDRYGICALGKYTRAEVFSSHDSLGGF